MTAAAAPARSRLPAAVATSLLLGWLAGPAAAQDAPALDVTFVFTNDIHACRMGEGLSPNCEEEGKTDAALLRHVAAINALPGHPWPRDIARAPTRLAGAGSPIAPPSASSPAAT